MMKNEIKQKRDSCPLDSLLWLFYNAELRYAAALEEASGIEIEAWKHICRELKKQMNRGEISLKPHLKFMPPAEPFPGFSRAASAVLRNRGVAGDIHRFIEAPLEELKADDMEGTKDAEKLIKRALSKKVPITIYGDYDADGITGTSLAVAALRKIGAAVDYYINKRSAGYAVSEEGIREIASRGTPRLLITVDNGVSSPEAIKLAKKLRMGVIVTDHHKIHDNPEPHVLVHPCCHHTPLAGVGVIFKVIHCLYKSLGRDDAFDFLDLVAVGTIADLVPLIGENRILVKNGLKLLNRKISAPVRAIAEALRIGHFNSQAIAYQVAPLLNALSRISGTAEQAVEFWLTQDYTEAISTVGYLKKLNDRRKEMVEEQAEDAERLVDTSEKILIVKSDFSEGIIGILAGRLKSKYGRPAIVLTENGEYYKGSCRSVPGIDIEEVLRQCQGVENFGGHSMAAGLTVRKENFELFYRSVLSFAEKIELRPPEIMIDAILKKEEINLALVRELDEMEPFGEGFPLPVFIYECSPVEKIEAINGKHLKIIDEPGAVVWNSYQKYLEQKPRGMKLLGLPVFDSYSGVVQFIADDFIPA